METASHRPMPAVMAHLTINDIARLSGVSKKTVSKVLNRADQVGAATRERVQRVIADNGYVPNPQARALALKRNFLVALVHDGSDPLALIDALDGVEIGLADSDFAAVVRRIDRDGGGPAQMAGFLASHRPAGVLLLPALAGDAELLAACHQAGCRTLRLGAQQTGDDALCCAERAGVADAVARLVALGHRRIAMVTGPESSLRAQARELGYLDALADHDLDRGPALVATGDFGLASGREAGRLLLQVSPRPTAILAASDDMAIGVIKAALDAGITIPGDLSVIGFGDTEFARRTWPPLASVRLPLREMATHAAHRIIGSDETVTAAETWPAGLVERASLAPAPA